MTHPESSTMASATWPPTCRSTLSNCTCCCILTAHTHLSDASGYPHLNHIVRFPHTDGEVLAWFHCPHCPCTLALSWVHPNEMPSVEESMSTATWLPRMADFAGYTPPFDDAAPSFERPPLDMSTPTVLMDRMNGSSLPGIPASTPLVHKPQIDGTRKSTRKSKRSASIDVIVETPEAARSTYKPRKSKYDIR